MSTRMQIHDGTVLVEQADGPDGPTHFVRLGTERITPRAAGDLIIDPNVAAIDWETGWIYPTFTNGWTNYNPSTHVVARYRKSSNNLVINEGLIKGGTVGAGAYTLASGYRSAHRLIMSMMSVDNSSNNRTDLIADGRVLPVSPSSNGWVSVQFMFYADGS